LPAASMASIKSQSPRRHRLVRSLAAGSDREYSRQ